MSTYGFEYEARVRSTFTAVWRETIESSYTPHGDGGGLEYKTPVYSSFEDLNEAAKEVANKVKPFIIDTGQGAGIHVHMGGFNVSLREMANIFMFLNRPTPSAKLDVLSGRTGQMVRKASSLHYQIAKEFWDTNDLKARAFYTPPIPKQLKEVGYGKTIPLPTYLTPRYVECIKSFSPIIPSNYRTSYNESVAYSYPLMENSNASHDQWTWKKPTKKMPMFNIGRGSKLAYNSLGTYELRMFHSAPELLQPAVQFLHSLELISKECSARNVRMNMQHWKAMVNKDPKFKELKDLAKKRDVI